MKPPEYSRHALRVIGVAILAASVAPMVGHTFRVPELYTFPGSVPMAVMTAACLFLTGLGFVVISRHDN